MYEKLSQSPAFPYDPAVGQYQVCHMYPIPLFYGSWEEENLSWKETCAIFAGLFPINTVARINGPDATRLLSEFTTTSYDKFPAGKLKHTIMCDDEGRVLTHGLIVRLAENDYIGYTLTPYLNFAQSKVNYDVNIEDISFAEFNFQCTGPRILETLEAASGECIHDIPFMGHKTLKICGHEVRLYRMGMAGSLGYEVHGHIDHAREIYQRIVDAGQPFGIKRVGWLSYAAQLAEGGFQQDQYTFHTASHIDPGYLEFLTGIGYDINVWPGKQMMAGSAGPDHGKRYRNPLELGWKNSVSFRHEFRGKAALEKEAANPTRKTVTLLWNTDDIKQVYGSLFEKGEEPYRIMDLPVDPTLRNAAVRHQFQDDVLDKHGNLAGCSNGRVYSLYSRDMTSMGVIDVDHAELGTELQILWGEPGHRQARVRAVVAPFPHLQVASNKTLDVASVPCILNG